MSKTPDVIAQGLEPEDWDALRKEAHDALDLAMDHIRSRPERPIWKAPPKNLSETLDEPIPMKGSATPELLRYLQEHIMGADLGNTHPRFFGWVHGTGNPAGVVPAVLEAAINANMGGREHAPIYLERQLVNWWKEMFAFPETAGGLTVSGTSMATIIAMKAALVRRCGLSVRDEGVASAPDLVAYSSEQAHSCVARAFDVLGLGKARLQKVPTNDALEMDAKEAERMIEADRAAGRVPFVIVGTAGTVNTAAIDPLEELSGLAHKHDLWFHVDGAFGAMAILSEALRPRIKGIELADSVAFDFHKWMHVTYDAGLILVRDQSHLVDAFSERPEYLRSHSKGMASGGIWPCELGPELSRGFRALKVWYQLSHYGVERLAHCIENNVRQAGLLAELVREQKDLELLAPVSLNIVCFRFCWPGDDRQSANEKTTTLVAELQTKGIAAPSTTTLDGVTAIRVNLTNHRTQDSDLRALIDAVIEHGRSL